MEVRLGKDWKAIAHLNYWKDREVDEYMMSLLASYENFQFVTFKQRWGVEPTRIQRLIGSWIAGTIDPEQDEGHLRGVMAFRAATKTAIASNFCAWLTLLDPRISVKVVSGRDDYAEAITKECRVWFDVVDFLRELLHPDLNVGTAAMKDNAKAFNVPGNPGGKDATFSAVAIAGNITSTRAHIILMDDIEHPLNCDTAGKREKLRKQDAEANNILFDAKACESTGILFPGFKPFKMYLGTPHTEESIYSLKMTQGYRFRVWPARYPNTEYMKTVGHLVCPELLSDLQDNPSLGSGYGIDFKQGRIVDPMRQSEESVCQKEIEEGRAGFAKQYMLDVSLQNIDKYPLKIMDLIVTDLDPTKARASYMSERNPDYEFRDLPCVGLPGDRYYRPSFLDQQVYEYERIIMAVDPSGRGSDETTYAVVGTLNGNFFLLDSMGLAGGHQDGHSDEVLEKIVNAAKRWKVSKIIVETNFGDGMFAKLLNPFVQKLYPVSVEESRVHTQKEVRIIETLEKVLSRRKLIVNASVVRQDYDNVPGGAKDTEKPTFRLFYQLARISRDKGSLVHDDRLDSLEAAIRFLISSLEIDQDTANEQRDRAWLKKMSKPQGVLKSMGLTPPSTSKPSFLKKRR